MTLLSVSALAVLSAAQQQYTNTVYYATSNMMPTTLSTNSVSAEQSSRDVLKELGVDLASEGRPFINHAQVSFRKTTKH